MDEGWSRWDDAEEEEVEEEVLQVPFELGVVDGGQRDDVVEDVDEVATADDDDDDANDVAEGGEGPEELELFELDEGEEEIGVTPEDDRRTLLLLPM